MAAFSIPPLPFGYDALTGKGFSKEQLSFHYDKHHTGYVTKLNAAAKENEAIGKKTIEELILHEKGPLFNLAAQIWNHTFYWNCLASNGGGTPGGKIGSAIDDNFGSFPKFKEEFTNAAVGHFGSGWAWLVKDDAGKLKVMSTHDAGNPMTEGLKPVLTCDVWEHAYYIDFRNDRAAYMKAYWDAVNWQFAESNL